MGALQEAKGQRDDSPSPVRLQFIACKLIYAVHESRTIEQISAGPRASNKLDPSPDWKQKYEADVRLIPLAQSPAPGAAPGLPNLPSNQ